MKMPALFSVWPAVLIGVSVACGLFWLDGWWSLGNLALLLILGNTLASFWLSTPACVVVSALAVAGFNWFFVAPRHTFHVQLDQDLMLLITLLGTSTVMSVLTSRLRQHAQQQAGQARHAEHMQQLALQLQQAHTVSQQSQTACQLLSPWIGLPVQVWLQGQSPTPEDPLYRAWQASEHEQGALGSGTGRHESLNAWVLPLRAGVMRIGSLAIGPLPTGTFVATWSHERLMAAARLLADEIHRLQSALQARDAHDRLQAQQLRNTLLAAISHDYRTPLATITGAASGLLDQPSLQRTREAAHTILQEAEHLHRMTTNTLQMARLDTVDTALQVHWESVEELCGVAMAAARRRHPERTLEVQVPSELPWLLCDAVLVVQLLDNLLENALRYSPDTEVVTLQVSLHDQAIQMAVLDRGIGIPVEWHERVFDPFRRVLPTEKADTGFANSPRRGMGLGLALCRAIARVHHARLWIESRPGGGTAVCLRFPSQVQPSSAPESGLEEYTP
jgi:two-component system sensor histidine kinase KdpD